LARGLQIYKCEDQTVKKEIVKSMNKKYMNCK
jgi:hypothetical protein